jgi:hypothetical protein
MILKDEFIKDRRGISGVVVAILLTVIGIAGVVLLWTVILPMFYRLDFQILDTKLIVVEGGENIVQIKIWNTGGVDITKLTVEGDVSTDLLEGGDVLKAGDQRTFVKRGISLQAGKTYVLIVKAEGSAPFGGLRKSEQSITVTAVKA